jgi:hypothetical protein
MPNRKIPMKFSSITQLETSFGLSYFANGRERYLGRTIAIFIFSSFFTQLPTSEASFGTVNELHVSRHQWTEAARNAIALETYESVRKPLGCESDCKAEDHGFLTAFAIRVMSKVDCDSAQFASNSMRKGCFAYLVTLKSEVEELQRDYVEPPIFCIDERTVMDSLLAQESAI